jgi:gamma-glutamyl:cysteine ligase YbdK (ATP-grasp superfamily)
MGPCIGVVFLSITNKMQRYTVSFIIVNAVHVSGGFSAHHQELKYCTHNIWYVPGLLAANASGSSKQA